MTGISGFGSRVIGEKAAERERLIKEKGRDVFGPRITGRVPELDGPESEAPEQGLASEPASEPTSALSIKKLTEALDENPYTVERYFEDELVRPDGPRVSAFRIMLATEKRLPTPNDEIVAGLESEVARLEALAEGDAE